jgi:4-amino-4-deoxy-L-arabinose transferase-like glycosyltransferase
MAPTASFNQTKDRPASSRLLILMVLVALALRLAAIPLPNFEDLMDANHIHAWEPGNTARNLLAGRGFGSTLDSTQRSAMIAPVYPLIVALDFRIFGVHTAHSILAIHVFDCLINSLACIPIFLLARRSFGERAARWSGWAWAIFPYGIYFSAAMAWSTHLLLLSLCCLLYLAQDLEQSPRLGLWAGFGLLAGFAGLTEPSVLVVVSFLLALACWRLARDGKRWFVPGCVAGVVMMAALSPWMIRNALAFHRFIPMRDNMGLELWMGNNGVSHSLDQTSDDLHPLHDMAELADYNRMGELAYMDHKMQQAKAFISAHPGLFIWKSVRRAVYVWTGFWSLDPAYRAGDPTELPNVFFATSLTLLALAGLYSALREKPFEAIRYGGVLFLFPVMYYFTHPEPYHLRPLDPIMVILGIYAILTLRARIREGVGKAAGSVAVAG